MHILLIHQIFVTPDEGGGTRHYELAKYLVERGNKVTVIASDVDYLSGRKKNRKREAKEGIEIIYSYTLPGVNHNFMLRVASFLSFSITSFINSLKIKDVDIIWGTSPPLFQAFASFMVSKVKQKPFVFEVRDLWLDFARELKIVRAKLVFYPLKKIEKMLYKGSDKIIANSPGFIPFIEKDAHSGKVVLIPNGVTTVDFKFKKSSVDKFRRKQGLTGKFVVLYAGNIGLANDIETIIKSAELLKDKKNILFLLAGGGIKKQYFIEYCKSRKINNVRFIGLFPKKQIPAVISASDICLATLKNIPLFKTTYPNKVFDYMAAGKPTILAIDGAVREVIDKSSGGVFVEPGNSRKIADAILKYYENPALAQAHGNNAMAHVKKNFERKDIAEKLEKTFESILKNNK